MKKKLILIISFIVILGIIVGTTLAWIRWNSTNTNVTFNIEGATITYNGGADISNVMLIPVSSKEKSEMDGTGIAKEITASANKTMYLTLNLDLITFPSNLADKSLVWEIYKGNEKIGNGNFSGRTQGNSITLLNSKKINNTTSTFKLYIWIDGLQDNPSTMQNQSFVFHLNATASDNEPQQPNVPKLVQGLIPVKYDDTNSTWVKADSKNENDTWYDYKNKKWANAVLVNDTNRNTYISSNTAAGTPIPEAEILAYYVWIPRYKYKVWNMSKSPKAESEYIYNAYSEGIDIIFEEGTSKTGTISCSYNYNIDSENGGINLKTSSAETCTGSEGNYYTHPAFTFGNNEVEGIWISKFKLSSENPTTSYGGADTVNLTPRFLPNTKYWRKNIPTNYHKVIYDMQNNNNIYGLSTNRENTDSHMIKNMEWGAVAYLTNSNYGRCNSGLCEKVAYNSKIYTANNNIVESTSQSTTNNIYGIYDMNSITQEYVMANVSSSQTSYVYQAASAGDNFTYNENTAKYIDTYAYHTNSINPYSYNRTKLGDATSETAFSTGNGWYRDAQNLPTANSPWMLRGTDRTFGESNMGIFGSGYDTGNGTDAVEVTSRAALIGL